MEDFNVYNDYYSWKHEKYDLIHALVKQKSKCISRFTHVIAVVDYLYDEYFKTKKLSQEKELIFQTGFNYIFKRFMTIENILISEFKNSISEMNKYAKTINIILYINDFQDDLENVDNAESQLKKLADLEQQAFLLLSKRENASDEFFMIVDSLTSQIYEELDSQYYGVNDIMYDIAVNMNLAVADLSASEYYNHFLATYEK